MRLSEALKIAGVRPRSLRSDADVTWVEDDSRRVRPGSLFVCMPSANTDSHKFLGQAAESGANAVVLHSEAGFAQTELPAVLLSEDPRGRMRELSQLCRTVLGSPDRGMRVTAITGTNGKTTTAWIVRDMLSALGRNAAYAGTLGYKDSGPLRELRNTTPFPVDLWQILHAASEAGVEDFVFEASSHALYEARLHGLHVDVGVFTNLTQDHLDYHGTMDAYAEAKKLLWSDYGASKGVFNAEDAYGARWLAEFGGVGYGLESGDFRPTLARAHVDHIDLEFDTVRARVGLGGTFNVWNSVAAAATLRALDYSVAEIGHALAHATPVPGRFEPVGNPLGIGVIVDYAHTPDALEKLLQSAREVTRGKLIAVFGCGGDRDRTKRPKMAHAASSIADVTVVTSDNPRTEDPDSIVREVETGLVPGKQSLTVVDRREAVARAVSMAEPGDLVVIAGKGHEDYQIIGREKIHMDDRELAREALEARS